MSFDTEESRKNLTALRKLFRLLEFRVSSLKSKWSREQKLVSIIFAEAAFRILKKRKEAGDLSLLMMLLEEQLADSLKGTISTALPKLGIPDPKLIESLKTELEKHEDLLEKFDERCSGYFYQWHCEEARDKALERIQTADKQSSISDLIHFTQLYTPDWVADYLFAETIKGKDRTVSLSELRILDPACGAGHILVRLLPPLMEMYENAGIKPDEALSRILTYNIRGCDIDIQSLWICGLSLLSSAMSRTSELKKIEVKLCLFDVSSTSTKAKSEIETGSLRTDWPSDHPLSEQAHIVLANPPYIGRRLMDRRMKNYLRENYPESQHDLSAAFLSRALQLLLPGGKLGFITQSSLLFLPSYEDLRRTWLERGLIDTVVELGSRVFPLNNGEKINSMMIIMHKDSSAGASSNEHTIRFLDLRSSQNKNSELGSANYSERSSKDFLDQRACALNYRCPPVLGRILKNSRKLFEIADVKQGLATSDNNRFLRFWWDVPKEEIGQRWKPYVKGAGSERWGAVIETVVDWGDDGGKIKEAVEKNYPYLNGKVAWVVKNEQYYFRPGLTFSFVNTGRFAVRKMPAGCIFDVGGSGLFSNESDRNRDDFLLAYLNSTFAALCADLLNPTFNSQVGDIKEIPLLDFAEKEIQTLDELAKKANAIRSSQLRFEETDFRYIRPSEIDAILKGADPEPIWVELLAAINSKSAELLEIESKIDKLILEALIRIPELSASEIELIESTISDHMKGFRTETAAPSKQKFALHVLRESLRDLLASTIEASLNDLSLPAKIKTWIETCIGFSVENYMRNEFNKDQETIFHGSPQIICLPAGASEMILSCSALRTHCNLAPVGAALKLRTIPNSTIQFLISSENWTGKDLLKYLS